MRRLPVLPVAVAIVSCALPSDQSTGFTVVLDSVPELFAGDTVQAAAHVIDGSGQVVGGIAIEFGSTDPTVASVTADGRVAAVSPGTLSVLAWAPGLESATQARTPAIVHGAIQIDSIRPSRVRYGSPLEIYGIGLDPSGAAVVSTGAVNAPILSFTPADPAHPEQHGVLTVVVVPPLGENSDEVTPIDVPVTVTNTRGVATRVASVVIEPRDLYEPNDTTPTDLGVISGPFEALGLAFDNWASDSPGYPVDWYRFTTTSPGDWTITLRSADAGQTEATADLIEGPLPVSVEEDGIDNFNVYWYIDRPSRRTIGTSSTCRGFAGFLDIEFDPPRPSRYGVGWAALEPQLSWTLENLPAGTHDLLVSSFFVLASPDAPGTLPPDGLFRSAFHTQRFNPAGPAIRYDLIIEPGIHAALPPDRFEGNDFCEDAPTLLSLTSTAFSDSVVQGLTIDAELDYDWFVVDARAPGRLYVTVESDDQNAKPIPLVLSATPGSGPSASRVDLEGFADGNGSFGSPQEFVSNRDFAPGVSLDSRSYYLEIAGELPRAYRLRFTWVPGSSMINGLFAGPRPTAKQKPRVLRHHAGLLGSRRADVGRKDRRF
jgi:hypothetical protein